ncbi:C4-dicarboxylate ABC transporter substrate-binding protein [Alkalihalophilus pseudofirmus]|uniref:TRAP transporter substrate-binding protein DctP n=1 Tax=Alkalihalophilus pseudofirmus TaxID=79885 RepID=UPI00095346D5|nr:C4-dicarboxylate ABC transporter substrate-binding protein [Alkalihalophilus pseudofirmus]
MKKRKILSIASTTACLLWLTACGGSDEVSSEAEAAEAPASDEVITLKVGHIAPPEEAYALGFDAYAEAVEEATDGRVQFEIFGNGALGGERELLEGVQLANLDMSVITTGVVTNFVPEVTAIEFPFLFRDLDHAYQTLDSDIGQELLDTMSNAGLKGISFWENGQRHIANNQQPVKTPDDLKGLKMRTIESDLLLDTYSALGTNATPMAFPEVYGGLQQGVIDGSDFSYGVISSTNVYEQVDHFTEAGLYYASATLLMNDDLYESLPADIQETLVTLGKEFAATQREISQTLEEEQKQQLLDNGVEIISAEELDLDAFREQVQPVYEKYEEQYGNILERIANVE